MREGASLDSINIKRIIRGYYKQLYVNKFHNLDDMDNFLERFKLLKLSQEEIDNLNSPIFTKEIKFV